jgi:hypothetical protein
VIPLFHESEFQLVPGLPHGNDPAFFTPKEIACGAPPVVSALVLGIFSNLMGCTTHYGIGSAPPFFGAGYVDLPTWWKIGGALSVVYIVVFHWHI